jgi:GDP-D-mannose 3',5'-epimerase
MKKICILGASGFLGGHLEHRLKEEGHFVVSVARKIPPFRKSVADEFNVLDLTNPSEFHAHFFRHQFDEVYQLAGNVGGLGHIGTGVNDVAIMTESLKINLHTLEAIAKNQMAGKVFFASSQCVYPDRFEIDPFASERIVTDEDFLSFRENGYLSRHDSAHREIDADFNTFAFGQEKLFSEKLYDAYARNHGLEVRIGRCGNTYGPYCTWSGDRAKAPAALCRKVAQAEYGAPVEIWGNGGVRRSFTFVDDIVEGMIRLMASDYNQPVNLAHGDTVTIMELFETILRVSGKILAPRWVDGPVGVQARGSDNSLCRAVLQWEPETSLFDGLSETYHWVAKQALTTAAA